MKEPVKWTKCRLPCPEGKGEAELFAEWRLDGEQYLLNGIHCANPELRDLSWKDCRWTCWESVEGEASSRKT